MTKEEKIQRLMLKMKSNVYTKKLRMNYCINDNDAKSIYDWVSMHIDNCSRIKRRLKKKILNL